MVMTILVLVYIPWGFVSSRNGIDYPFYLKVFFHRINLIEPKK